MSRTEAAGKRRRRSGKVVRPGRVTREMMQSWVREKGVILRGGGVDESPHVYRRLPEVLAAQGPTVEVLHTLRPEYSRDSDALIAASHVVAVHFQTIAAANDYWR